VENQIRILLPDELAVAVAKKFGLSTALDPADDRSPPVLRLGLEEAAAWITVIVGIGQLTEWSTELAQIAIAWHAAKQRAVTPILIQGPADDSAVLLTAATPPDAVVRAVKTAVGS
jgi:hypothetical protein